MLKDARVNVQVANYSPFYIRGEVKKAGEFPYRPGMTVSDAVALAGGYTYRADESKVYVRSARAAGEIMRLLETDIPVSVSSKRGDPPAALADQPHTFALVGTIPAGQATAWLTVHARPIWKFAGPS